MFRKFIIVLTASTALCTSAYAGGIGEVGSPNLVMPKQAAAPKKAAAPASTPKPGNKPAVTLRLDKNHVNMEAPLRRAVTDRQNAVYTIVGFGPKDAGARVRDAMNEAHQIMVQELGINPDNITMRQESSASDKTAELRVYKTAAGKARN